MPDGRFLTPVAGLHYVLHLFDQSENLFQSANLNGDSKLSLVQEQVRHHEDRMSYLENRHNGLQRQVSNKVAVDSEFGDWLQNRNEEEWLMIRGLPRLNVSRQDWPNAARRQVADMIKLVLSTNRIRLDFEVVLVSNPFSRTTTGPTLYNVRMDSAHTSKRIREIFSGFFRRIRPVQMPPALKGIEVRNKVTLETKIRIAILRRLGERYRDTNPGSSYIVRGFDSRTTIFITPPKNSTEQARKYNFIQAATTLPATFTDEDLAVIFQTVGDRFRGKLQSIFLVLNDDDHDRCLELAKNHNRGPRRGGPAQPSGSGPGPGSGLGTSSSTSFGHVHGRGHGVDAQDSRPAQVSGSGGDLDPKFLSSLISPPPPPAEIETENSRAHDDRVRRRREQERQQSPSPDRRHHEPKNLTAYGESSIGQNESNVEYFMIKMFSLRLVFDKQNNTISRK